jgi:hypothetical protein
MASSIFSAFDMFICILTIEKEKSYGLDWDSYGLTWNSKRIYVKKAPSGKNPKASYLIIFEDCASLLSFSYASVSIPRIAQISSSITLIPGLRKFCELNPTKRTQSTHRTAPCHVVKDFLINANPSAYTSFILDEFKHVKM